MPATRRLARFKTQLDDNGKEVMVAAASQKLNEAEVKWSTYDKKMFGLIWAVRHFSHYLKRSCLSLGSSAGGSA